MTNARKDTPNKRIWAGRICVVIILFFLIWHSIRYFVGFDSCVTDESAGYGVYYLLNIDGMGGLGHTAVLLRDADGVGTIYSYNGMQYNFVQCLFGREGVGKMTMMEMDSDETNEFLHTGDAVSAQLSECDNFDRVVYRQLSSEEYESAKSYVAGYIRAGDEYEALFARMANATDDKAERTKELNDFVAKQDIPKYNIYCHNCDTVARETIATFDKNMEDFNELRAGLFPSANCHKMTKRLGGSWKSGKLGGDTLKEKILWFLF